MFFFSFWSWTWGGTVRIYTQFMWTDLLGESPRNTSHQLQHPSHCRSHNNLQGHFQFWTTSFQQCAKVTRSYLPLRRACHIGVSEICWSSFFMKWDKRRLLFWAIAKKIITLRDSWWECCKKAKCHLRLTYCQLYDQAIQASPANPNLFNILSWVGSKICKVGLWQSALSWFLTIDTFPMELWPFEL